MTIRPGDIHHKRYKFEQLIGQGAFGITWQGQHMTLQRPVAIKVIDAGKLAQENLERAIRECQIGGQLNNVHIVNVFDAYQEGSNLCIVMEFMPHGNLKDYLANHRPSLEQGLAWGLDLTQALAAVHQQGIIHRDIKPANILLAEDDTVKIADFGIAHLPNSQLTGEFQPGTPAYRSPEQEKNQPVDAATDVYTLSVVLFEIFSGEKFFQRKGMTLTEWRRTLRHRLAQRHPTVPELSLADLTDALVDGLAEDKTMRSTVSELQQALSEVLNTLTRAEQSQEVPRQSVPTETIPPPDNVQDDMAEKTPIARIGRYELQAVIGRGGMGTVHKAYDPQIGRLIALKAITIVDPSWRARFQQEVRIAGRLNHPHIVTVYDVGEVGDTAYIVMELVEGQTLADLLPSRQVWPEAVKLLLPVCQALDYAHQQEIVHRDVKPANILLAADGRIKLTDFGIARLETGQGLTQTGTVMGTLQYMAPEQLAGENVDERSDIFALGVILFELVTGQNPFVSEESTPRLEYLLHGRSAHFALLSDLAPRSLQAVIQRAMAEDPSNRFVTSADMANALNAILDEHISRELLPGTSPPVRQTTIEGQVELSVDEQNLLAESFSGYERLYIENELTDPSNDARLLVVLPVRSGRSLTRVIIKLASPEILTQEWRAYQEYVADILPMVTAHIQAAPLLSPNRKLALLRYTFTGDLGRQQAQSLNAYFQNHTGTEIANLLERNIFQAVGPNWWLNRKADVFPLGHEYDRLLPVHLVVERTTQLEKQPQVLKAGAVTVQDVHHLSNGQSVQVQGFRVRHIRAERQEMILEVPPATSRTTERLRLKLTGLLADELNYQPGDLAPNFAGIIITNRPQILREAAQVGWPNVDLNGSTIEINGTRFPNPLHEYNRLLERTISGMKSTIHGHLAFESILIEPNSGLTWLINFADTRLGHNIYDFLQFETQIVTRLLPNLMSEMGDVNSGIDEIIAMIQALHTSTPPPRAPHPVLQKTYDLLKTVRRMTGQCLLDADNWDEYYLGLVIMALGSLPANVENPTVSRLAIAWAAVACGLIGQTLPSPVYSQDSPIPKKSLPTYVWVALGTVVGLIGTAAAFSLLMENPSPTPTPTQPTIPPSFTPSLTPTSAATPTLSPISSTPRPVTGVLKGDLNVFAGPGDNYPFVGSISEGVRVYVLGRDPGNTWWQISYPEGPGGHGWIEAQYIKTEVTPILPPATAAPPPTFTPTPTETHTPTSTPTFTPSPTNTPIPPTITLTPTPTGSPTPGNNVPRQPVSGTSGYLFLAKSIGRESFNSAAFSPNGKELAATEGVKLYTIGIDASAPHVWMEEDENIRPVEGIVWSPDGRYFAFVADRKKNCSPCRTIGIAILSNLQIQFLEPPEGQAIGLPRWAQDSRLMVTIYQNDPASGRTYIYDASGRGQVASGTYILSSSDKGQSLYPWQPGKTWQVDQTRPHQYYDD